MNDQERKSIIEGLLYVSGNEGIQLKEIAGVLEMPESEAADLIEDLKKEYESGRGLMITEVADVYQFTTKPEHADYYRRLVQSPSSAGLSQAAMETLAIIAYRQPITRAEIEDVRGVKTERPLQTLMSKTLIKQAGRAEGTGRAILYATTREFLEYFGLKSIDELPPLPECVDEQEVEQEADLFFEKFKETVVEKEEEQAE
ncbi:SMC-Scp complex subunit ScpB [Bacillus marinisedimentorum]|uniref:SMC-Scp complex subunit ScpB n=1 Tax=Bacillus marinisedimentorum TaxID=1821260 RepID=UPI0008731E23|nr:SMC-Scp complex subunit ScpB [Bacillus marinisedimentorum]